MRLLVTGATGFVGSHLVTVLARRGHSIAAVVRDAERARRASWYGRTDLVVADLHRESDVARLEPAELDAVVHLAWPGLPNYGSPSHVDQTLCGELALVKRLAERGTRHLVVTGTCFEYGLQNGRLDEGMEARPVTPYAIAKDTLRRYLEAMRKETRFRLQWPRLFYLRGPGQSPQSLLPQLDRAIDRGDAVFNMSGGEQLRDYLPVETCAEYLAAVIEHPSHEGIVNVCSGKPISVRRLVEEHVARRRSSITLNLGHYPYPEHEPMAFWGDDTKLRRLLETGRA
jgi:dTDP-6-deoxy-L-talose 4-dehydrogenase (NAD+)